MPLTSIRVNGLEIIREVTADECYPFVAKRILRLTMKSFKKWLRSLFARFV